MNAMNNKLVFAGLLAGILLSCSRHEVDFRESNGDTVFYASLEQPVPTDTRVYADENLMVLWHADDRVSIFDRYTYNQEYRFTGETGDNSGAFQKVPGIDPDQQCPGPDVDAAVRTDVCRPIIRPRRQHDGIRYGGQ